MKTSTAIVIVLLTALIVLLAATAIHKRNAARDAPFVPPGWVGPTSPPPSAHQ